MPKDKKIIIGGNVSKSSCGCQPVNLNESRRSLLKMAALGVAAGVASTGSSLAGAAESDPDNLERAARPKPGDFLVSDKKVSSPEPVRIEDLKVESPTIAYPYEVESGIVRDASRLNRIVLLRFDEAEIPDEVAANAAGGVLAFSAVCTHQGCDVDTWMGNGVLACFCHGSMFLPLEGGIVSAGPAPRPMPVLPVTERDGLIMVAEGFRSSPGF